MEWMEIEEVMLMKQLRMLGMTPILIVLMTFMFACGNNDEVIEENQERVATDKVFTLEELSEYDGKDGSPAYVAVDGVVYDVSDSNRWRNGEHNNNQAGNDLTEAIIESSPHGTGVLERMPVVGTLEE